MHISSVGDEIKKISLLQIEKIIPMLQDTHYACLTAEQNTNIR